MHIVLRTMQTFSIWEGDKSQPRLWANQEDCTEKEEAAAEARQQTRIDVGTRPAIGNSRSARMNIPGEQAQLVVRAQ